MSEDTIQYLVLHRCDPTCNMARYYVLSIETSPFGDASLIREWGRTGRPGRKRIELYETQSMPWKLLRLGFSESADVATRSELGRRIAATEIGIILHLSTIATVTSNRIGCNQP
jgi:predicted DNA-binding WGR domain protein